MKNTFDQTPLNIENHFHKNNAKILNQLFGYSDVKSFWIADMDFQIAEPITKEIKRIAQRAVYSYEFNSEYVLEALVKWNKERHQLTLEKENFVQVNGVLTGISLLIQELTLEGDGIILQTPVYHKFAHIVEATNRKIINNPLQLINGSYEMDFEDLESKCKTANAKLIILCNPHNPIGRVWTSKELQKLSSIANKYNIRIVSDEIHSEIVYPGNSFNSILSLNDSQHIALIGSPAKTFGMQSFANGYIYIQDPKTYERVHKKSEALFLNHGNVFTNYATIAAYREGSEWLDELLVYLKSNIEWIESFLKETLPKVKLIKPEGTYQVWLDFRGLGITNKSLNKILLEKAKIALAPGIWFGKDGYGFMRMNIASPLIKIQDALHAIAIALKEK